MVSGSLTYLRRLGYLEHILGLLIISFGTARREDIFPEDEALPCLVSVNGNTVLVECKDDTCSADERRPLKLDGELFA